MFNENNPDYYFDLTSEMKQRTRTRILEIKSCGMSEVGYGEFGFPGIMSGLYIEKVWNYSDIDFMEYMSWAKELIKRKHK